MPRHRRNFLTTTSALIGAAALILMASPALAVADTSHLPDTSVLSGEVGRPLYAPDAPRTISSPVETATPTPTPMATGYISPLQPIQMPRPLYSPQGTANVPTGSMAAPAPLMPNLASGGAPMVVPAPVTPPPMQPSLASQVSPTIVPSPPAASSLAIVTPAPAPAPITPPPVIAPTPMIAAAPQPLPKFPEVDAATAARAQAIMAAPQPAPAPVVVAQPAPIPTPAPKMMASPLAATPMETPRVAPVAAVPFTPPTPVIAPVPAAPLPTLPLASAPQPMPAPTPMPKPIAVTTVDRTITPATPANAVVDYYPPAATAAPVVVQQAEAPALSDQTRQILSKIPSRMDTQVTPRTSSMSLSRVAPEIQAVLGKKAEEEAYESVGISIKVRRPGLDTNYELNQAYTSLMGGDTQRAIEIYQNIVSNDPRNEDALFGLAATYHRLGQTAKARPFYGMLLKQNPNHREGLNNFLVLVSDESPQDALPELERLELRNPDFSPIPAQIAIVLDKLGYPDQAQAKMLRAIELAPDNLTYKYNLAIMLDRHGRYADASALYRVLIEAALRGESVPASTESMQKRLNYIATVVTQSQVGS